MFNSVPPRRDCPDQGRTRIFGPRKTGQEGVRVVRRNRKPAENAGQGKKGHLWMYTRLTAKQSNQRQCHGIRSMMRFDVLIGI